MKAAIVFVCVLACAFAVEEADLRGGYYRNPDNQATVLKSSDDRAPDGSSYHVGFETSNGINSESQATLKEVSPGLFVFEVQGSDSYTAPDGQKIETQYVADENGYRAFGAHLPTPPPTEAIPEYILRSLAYIESRRKYESQA